MMDRLMPTHTDGQLSVTRRLAHGLNKRLDSVCFYYTLLDYLLTFHLCMATINVCFCTKIHILPTSRPGSD